MAKSGKSVSALEGFLSSMNSYIKDESFLRITGIGTYFTKPVFLFFVNGRFMCVQIGHSICNVVTQIATKLFFVMNRSDMFCQIVLDFKSFVALITFKRAQYVHFFFVTV